MAIVNKFVTDEYINNNALLFIPQNLTDEQKNQVKANLGISNNTGEDITPTPPSGGVGNEESVTTTYTYTYDGDYNNDDHTWILNYGGVRIFAKMGEVPAGTLNLVGATLFRTNPSNQWLDKTFTITEEHLNKVLNKASTDIPAVQDGLIQIYDIMASDFSEFTVLCICTQPGWYNVTFDDWYEIINFPETGIYAYDKRTYGGNDYLQTFTFTTTTTPSNNEGGNSSSGGISTINPINYTGNEIQTFARGICIGDSVTEGSFDNNENGAIIKKYSYPAILNRITNVEIVNAGIAGATSKTWYEASLNSDEQWGKWFNDEWVWDMNPTASATDVVSSSLNYANFDFAIIHLGINDLGLMGDATIDDTLLTFETYINNIINALKNANQGIKIFLATIVPSYAPPGSAYYQSLNDKIKSIASNTNNVYLLDLNKYSKMASHEAYNRIHPTALGYHKLAKDIANYISYIINQNLNDFNAIQFIGTNYVLN